MTEESVRTVIVLAVLSAVDGSLIAPHSTGRSAASHSSARSAPPQLFFNNLFSSTPQPNPADEYAPDAGAPPVGLPTSYEDLHATAVDGVLAAVAAGVEVCEVDFPPIASVNARGDGSAKSEALVAAANAKFVAKLTDGLKRRAKATVTVIGCGGARAALGAGAVTLRDGAQLAATGDVALVVSPADIEQWEAAAALDCCVVIVNGLLNNGFAQHAYFYKPLTAFSAQTGGCVRRYPGPYQIYDATSGKVVDDLEVTLVRQGRRA